MSDSEPVNNEDEVAEDNLEETIDENESELDDDLEEQDDNMLLSISKTL